MKLAIFLFMVSLPLIAKGSNFVMHFLPAGTVRTDPLTYTQDGNCLSEHVHRFFGALSPKSMRPEVTYDDLRAAPGNTGDVGSDNLSLYWNPVIYKVVNPNSNQQSYEILPVEFASIYYLFKTGNTTAFPKGLKMKIDHKKAPPNKITSECTGPIPCSRTDQGGCDGYGPSNQANTKFLPLTACEVELFFELIFPTCWDGVNLEHPTNDHVAYNKECDDEYICFEYDCPASHPIKIPEINLFLVINNYEGGAHVFSDGTDMFHSDFMSGWDVPALQYVLDNCDNGSNIPDGGNFCTPWLKYSIEVTEGGTDEADHDMVKRIKATVPPAVNTQKTISPEKVTNVSQLPSGKCTGTLLPPSA